MDADTVCLTLKYQNTYQQRVKSFSEQPINSNSEIFKNVAKIATGQRDDSTRPCLFDHLQFIEQNKAANP